MKNTIKQICCALLLTALVLACADHDIAIDKDTFLYFEQHLTAEMNYEILKSVFGEPDGDIGSGIHIYVFNLDDGTRILIGYTTSIMYAKHVDNANQVLDVII